MRHAALLRFALLIGLAATSFHVQRQVLEAQSKQQTKGGSEAKIPADLLKTTVCEVVAAPDSFDGMMIEVRGKVFAGLETNILYDSNCRERNGLPERILFTTDDTHKGDLQPQEDGEYRKFWKLVGAYRHPKSKRHAMMPDKYTVTATLVGRYDVVKPSVPGTGFPGQLVLKSVHDVVAGPVESVF